jgi:hypothetical protein
VWGVAVPGLRAVFYRGADGTDTAGVYAYAGSEVFMAWGRTGRRHCDWHSFRTHDGAWELPRRGCPRVRAILRSGRVAGLLMRTKGGEREVTDDQCVSEAGRG